MFVVQNEPNTSTQVPYSNSSIQLFTLNVLDREADQTGKWISKNAPKK